MKICQKCGKEFPTQIWIDGKRRKLDSRKMCIECSPYTFKTKRDFQLYTFTCPTCGKEVLRNKGEMNKNKTGNFFCNSSCSAIFTNKTNPKRELEGSCDKCGKMIASRNKFCKSCRPTNASIDDMTYKDLKGRRKYQKNSQIRNHARKVYERHELQYTCIICGYDNHVDICHVRGISTFNESALIKEINDISNLIPLCRNHHWEFDRGIMSQEDIDKINLHLNI